ncbi:uncharacterized protein LY89DRAFT_683361 [Mollisia scopiformis]|uniref:Clr5 domain-containing protein n=1 Tax=Mollisia scopiformis TaxID=149040 RepID=A0A194XIE2_MOLSC|nr:uncharacterized protein LY89DRAFT_683361 [Mollisia scopiformis]KUJ19537.1 hypothetical protein LY89DRAFT_683361 [Mollisia scopiformis]
MSQIVEPERLNQLKNIIRSLYLVKGHPLEGPNGVIELMAKQHGFRATKAQYEKLLADCRKKRSNKDWKVVGQKIEKRKRQGKKSDVYLDKHLIPSKKVQKEISRHGFMTIEEQIQAKNGTDATLSFSVLYLRRFDQRLPHKPLLGSKS